MLTKEELKELETQFGKQASEEVKRQVDEAEKRLQTKHDDQLKGMITAKAFDDFKQEAFVEVNKTLKGLEEATTKQGNAINTIIEKRAPDSISFVDFLIGKADEIKSLREKGNMIQISGQQLKAAGVSSISGSIQDMTSPPGSPYIPGITNDLLQLFEIIRNPNFIIGQVDMGRTDQSKLVWANETDYQGTPALVAESGLKPLLQHKFQAQLSNAKKIAAYIKITEEFDQDLPQFGTVVRRLLQEDVIRGWDDQLQTEVIDASHPYEVASLDGAIYDANRWDALLSMLAQVYHYNFIPNTIGINPFTNVLLKTAKNIDGTYLLPAFAAEIQNLLVQANKVATGKAFVGDLKQFKVDIYKDFYIKIGLINDDLIHNEFAIVGELRYHSYISDNRTKALVYDSVGDVMDQIRGGFSSVGDSESA